jgi:hypothetical protein
MTGIDVRTRLAQFRRVGNPDPVYEASELAREPVKWLKYLLLDRFGIEPLWKIAHQIQRFRASEIQSAREFASARLSAASGRQTLIVAKIVPWTAGAQLRNYPMTHPDDVDRTFDEIATGIPDHSHEVWCCESSVSGDGLNLGGRLNLPRGLEVQVLELVWFASPREIERVQLPGFRFPYLRALRSVTAPTFAVDVLHVPDGASPGMRDVLVSDFRYVARSLQAKTPGLQALAGSLNHLGAREVCFCFKVVDGDLTVIDWDTEIESTTR